MRKIADDLGTVCRLPDGPVTRVISLVPSLTEAIAATRPAALVGATDWCTHPADLDVIRVRGTKNPNVHQIVEIAQASSAPLLVIANKEENRELDVHRLRDAGVTVWVTLVEDVLEAISGMERLFEVALQWGIPPWLGSVMRLWSRRSPAPVARVAVPIWRDPWMVVGSRNFTTDLLAHVGLDNVFGAHAERYPTLEVGAIDRAPVDAVLLPDEPYVFTPEDGPEAFVQAPTRLVSGRLLTWYGPSLIEARGVLDSLAGELADR
ncbi:MAG: cobalamin-binding protein [Intrasporangiaceae bacterium]|nr:cobalamin-binding protein [Intrasporangiaceae bacterium]